MNNKIMYGLFVLLGIVIGIIIMYSLMVFSFSYLVSQIRIEQFTIAFNETKIIELLNQTGVLP